MQAKLYIAFFHGRKSPQEELNEWGFKGPLIGPLAGMGGTYGDIKLYGEADNQVEDVPSHEGLWKIGEDYFGDFELVALPKKKIPEWLSSGHHLLSFTEFERIVQPDIYPQAS